jgi:hypothetical protein
MCCETWAPTTSDNMKMGYNAVEVSTDYSVLCLRAFDHAYILQIRFPNQSCEHDHLELIFQYAPIESSISHKLPYYKGTINDTIDKLHSDILLCL